MKKDVDRKSNSNELVLKKFYRKFIGDLLVLSGSIGIAFTMIAAKFMSVLEFEFSKTEEIDLATGYISKLKVGSGYGFSYLISFEPFNMVLVFFAILIIIGIFCWIKSKEVEGH